MKCAKCWNARGLVNRLVFGLLPVRGSCLVYGRVLERFLDIMQSIAIVGLGYVGLPLSLQFARSGARVIGLDIDSEKVELCNKGQSYIKHIHSETISEMRKKSQFEASTDFGRLRETSAVILCVTKTLNKNS